MARKAWRVLGAAVVLYEAPHRVAATVSDLVAAFGDDRTLVVAREITKAFETIARDCVSARRPHGSRRMRIASAASSC